MLASSETRGALYFDRWRPPVFTTKGQTDGIVLQLQDELASANGSTLNAGTQGT